MRNGEKFKEDIPQYKWENFQILTKTTAWNREVDVEIKLVKWYQKQFPKYCQLHGLSLEMSLMHMKILWREFMKTRDEGPKYENKIQLWYNPPQPEAASRCLQCIRIMGYLDIHFCITASYAYSTLVIQRIKFLKNYLLNTYYWDWTEKIIHHLQYNS